MIPAPALTAAEAAAAQQVLAAWEPPPGFTKIVRTHRPADAPADRTITLELLLEGGGDDFHIPIGRDPDPASLESLAQALRLVAVARWIQEGVAAARRPSPSGSSGEPPAS